MKIKRDKIKDQARSIVLDYIMTKENVDYEIQNLIPKLYDTKKQSLLGLTYQAFRKETNIPESIPIFSLFSYMANHLVKNEVVWTIPNILKDQRANLWIINLAPSGASKTYSLNLIDECIPMDENGQKKVSRNFEHCSGAKAFINEIKDKNNGFYVVDEAAKTLAAIETPGHPLSDTKELYLKAYDGQRLSRKNAEEEIVVENPCITILWLNTIQNFIDKISYESLADGFAQRFLYVLTERDFKRCAGDYPIYSKENILNSMQSEMTAVFNQELYKEYIVNEDVLEMYKDAFKRLWGEMKLCESFFRRVMFKAFTYSIIYHLLLKKEGNVLDREDLEYALRVCVIHLHSIKRLIQIKTKDDEGVIELKRIIEKVIEREQAGKSVKERDLISSVHGIDNKDDAEFVLELIKQAKIEAMGYDPLLSFDIQ